MAGMKNLDYFDKNYTIVASYACLKKGQRYYIGNKEDRICRFCGEKKPKVSFKLEAHAIPEFTGNKSLIAYDECDTCNELFSRIIEDHLGKYLGPQRTLSQISGKKGVPTYKGKDGRSRISMEEEGLKITAYEDNPIFDIDSESKTLTISAHRQPYIPAAVFKCFVKMAISIAPQGLLTEVGHLIRWIRDSEHKFDSFPYKPLAVIQQFTPGPMPYDGVSLFLVRRKLGVMGVPYLQFVVAFGNMMFQIVVPMPEQDKSLFGIPLEVPPFPVPFTEGYEYGKTLVRMLDLSSYELIKGEPLVMSMTFEHVRELDTF